MGKALWFSEPTNDSCCNNRQMVLIKEQLLGFVHTEATNRITTFQNKQGVYRSIAPTKAMTELLQQFAFYSG